MSDWNDIMWARRQEKGAPASYAEKMMDAHARRDFIEIAEEADAEIARLRAAHKENARILGFLVNELNGRIEGGKLSAVEACRKRSVAALEGGEK